MWCQCQHQWHHMMEKSDAASYFNHFDLRNALLPLMIPLASSDTTLVPMVSDDKEVRLHLILIVWSQQIQFCHCQCHQHCMMPMPTTQCINQRYHVAHHFTYFAWTNAIVVLMMPLTSHVLMLVFHWHHMTKKVCISFWSSWCNKWKSAIDDTVGIMWHWHHYQWCHMTKTFMLQHWFSHLDVMNIMELLSMPMAAHDADASATSVKWLKNLLYLIWIILT